MLEDQCTYPDDFPLSNDSSRENLLTFIQRKFKTLARENFLAPSYVVGTINFSMDEIPPPLLAKTQLLNSSSSQSTMYICLLEAQQLRSILISLHKLCSDFGLGFDLCTNSRDDLRCPNPFPELKENLVLNEDASFIFLDERILAAEVAPGVTESAAMDGGTYLSSSHVVHQQDTDTFIDWMFSCSSYRNGFELGWSRRIYNKSEGEKLVQALKDTHCNLSSLLLKKKAEPTDRGNALQLRKIDGEIMKSAAEAHQLELKLATICAFDYREIFLPMVKTYLKENLKDLGQKYVTQNCDAAAKAFLIDVTINSKEDDQEGSDSAKGLRDWIRLYWNSMSSHWKEEFLRIRVCDLENFFGCSKNVCLKDLIAEVLSNFKANKKWKNWICCSCGKCFSDPEYLSKHVEEEHVGNLTPKVLRLLPPRVDKEWIDKIVLDCSWKPLDASVAIKMIEDQAKGEDEEPNITKATDDRSIEYSLSDGWPMSTDSERATLLQKIPGGFILLIRHKLLAAIHLSTVIEFAMKEIPQELAFISQILNDALDQSPICICFLGAPQLKKILKFLLELYHVCGVVTNSGNILYAMDYLHNATPISEIKQKIVLSEDGSFLLDQCLQNTEAFLSWILSGSCYLDQLTLCLRKKEDNRCQGLKIIKTLEEEFEKLTKLFDNKSEQKNYEEALQAVEDLCLEEGKKRETSTECVHQSFGYVLRMRKNELMYVKNDSHGPELAAIKDVLQEAETMNVNQSGYKKNRAGICNLESQIDSYIETAIGKLKEKSSEELSKIDGSIMRSIAEMRQLKVKLESISAIEYRTILLPLMKMLLLEKLKDLFHKDAMEKSIAGIEAYLAQLAIESKKSVKSTQ